MIQCGSRFFVGAEFLFLLDFLLGSHQSKKLADHGKVSVVSYDSSTTMFPRPVF
jgi:hypothetical protein